MRPLIIIDLDVITVHLWKGSQEKEAAKFIEKVESNCFDVIVPYTLKELAEKWKYADLRDKVITFYNENASEISIEEIEEKLESFGVNDKEFVISLITHGIKEEDAALVMVASLFRADYLVTFNKKHLRSKESEICKALSIFNLPKIKIRTPQEVLKDLQNGEVQDGN